jgi:DNA-binding GntR family transcriptional regulator
MVQQKVKAGKSPVFVTKAGLARAHIQEMILSGQVREGQQFTAREVSEALAVSETPVREAISGLVAEGWLKFNAHHSVVVASISVDQIDEINELRGVLSFLAVKRGGRAYSKQTLAALESNIEEAAKAVDDADPQRYAEVNRQFHLLICDTPHTQWTHHLLTNLSSQTAVLRKGFAAVPSRMKASLDDHRAIVDAIRAGDIDLAGDLLVQHEHDASKALITALSQGAPEARTATPTTAQRPLAPTPARARPTKKRPGH